MCAKRQFSPINHATGEKKNCVTGLRNLTPIFPHLGNAPLIFKSWRETGALTFAANGPIWSLSLICRDDLSRENACPLTSYARFAISRGSTCTLCIYIFFLQPYTCHKYMFELILDQAVSGGNGAFYYSFIVPLSFKLFMAIWGAAMTREAKLGTQNNFQTERAWKQGGVRVSSLNSGHVSSTPSTCHTSIQIWNQHSDPFLLLILFFPPFITQFPTTFFAFKNGIRSPLTTSLC